MNKRIIACTAAALLAFSAKVKAMALPPHTVIIGNKAYSIDYIVKPANYAELNKELVSNSSSPVYYLNNNGIRDVFTGSAFSGHLPSLTYIDGNGEKYNYNSYNDTLVNIPAPLTAKASVTVGNGAILLKSITMKGCYIPDVVYFKVAGSSTAVPISSSNPNIKISVPSDTVEIQFLDGAQNLVAKGTLDVSSSTPYGTSRPITNINYEVGNSGGNILNGGLVAKSNNWIYFRNSGDKGNLYRVKTDGIDQTKLVDQDVQNINVVGNHIYYTQKLLDKTTKKYTTSIYELNTIGSNAKDILNNGKPIGKQGNKIYSNQLYDVDQMIVCGKWIYFTCVDSGNLCRIDIYGNLSSFSVISKDSVQDLNVWKNYLYFVNNSDDSRIYKIDMNSIGSSSLDMTRVSSISAKHINIVDNWIYYRNYYDDEKLYKMSIDGGTNTKLSDDMAFNINISGDWIYYVNHSDNDKLYKIMVDGAGGHEKVDDKGIVLSKSGSKVSDDRLDKLNVVDPWIYFTPSNDRSLNMYKIKVDGTSKTSVK